MEASFQARPWGYISPLLALAGLIGIRVMSGSLKKLTAFLCACLFVLGMVTSVAFGLMWFIPGMLRTTGYFVYTYRSFSGKVKPDGGSCYQGMPGPNCGTAAAASNFGFWKSAERRAAKAIMRGEPLGVSARQQCQNTPGGHELLVENSTQIDGVGAAVQSVLMYWR